MLSSLLRWWTPSRRANQHRSLTRLTLAALEDRLTPYVLSGYSWADPNITTSFMPDGTQMLGGYTSSLFADLNASVPTETWQREYARALQTWAQYTPLNFRIVPDDGTEQGLWSLEQGDPRFGDIRLGARPAPTNVLGVTQYPAHGSSASGDIRLNSSLTYSIGGIRDLYSVLLHESGHSLGLAHSSTPGSVMYYSYSDAYPGLTADDIAGIQAIYGARPHDAYDSAASNDTLGNATALPLSSGGANVRADLTSLADRDYYRVVAAGSSLTVSTDSRDLSLLAPRVLVYDAAGSLLGSAGADYGQVATLQLTGLTAGQTYYVVADGATGDVFGMGGYALDVRFGSAPPAAPPAAPSNLAAVAVSSGQVDLAWQDNAGDETGFRVESSTDGITFTPAGTAGANATSYTATGLAAGTTYHFRVRAYNSGGDSAWSNTAQATTSVVPPPPSPPAAPGNLTVVTVSSGRVDLAWQDNAGNETGFRIELSTDGVTFAPAGTTGANAASYSVTGLAAGTTYYFRVQATNGTGASAWSNTAQATTPPAPPPVVLPPDRFERNDTAATARYLGKFNGTSQTALTIHNAADVDWIAFSVNSGGTFRISIALQNAAGNLDLYVYDAQQRQLAGSISTADTEAVTLSLAGGQRYYLKVVSPDGGMNSYDLAVAKLGGKTGGGNNLLSGCGCPMCTGVATASNAQPFSANDGVERDSESDLPAVEFVPVADGSAHRTGRSADPVRSAAAPGAVWSQALRLLSGLDSPFRDDPAHPMWAAGDRA